MVPTLASRAGSGNVVKTSRNARGKKGAGRDRAAARSAAVCKAMREGAQGPRQERPARKARAPTQWHSHAPKPMEPGRGGAGPTIGVAVRKRRSAKAAAEEKGPASAQCGKVTGGRMSASDIADVEVAGSSQRACDLFVERFPLDAASEQVLRGLKTHERSRLLKEWAPKREPNSAARWGQILGGALRKLCIGARSGPAGKKQKKKREA